MPLFRRHKAEPFPPPTQDTELSIESSEPVQIEEWATGVVLMSDGVVRMEFQSIDQAKLAIKQLRLKKRELGVEKRSINADIQTLRQDRRDAVARQGPKMRGGGSVGKVVRSVQTASRQAEKQQHLASLAPHEQVKASIDQQVMNIDRVVTRIEQWMLENPTG